MQRQRTWPAYRATNRLTILCDQQAKGGERALPTEGWGQVVHTQAASCLTLDELSEWGAALTALSPLSFSHKIMTYLRPRHEKMSILN